MSATRRYISGSGHTSRSNSRGEGNSTCRLPASTAGCERGSDPASRRDCSPSGAIAGPRGNRCAVGRVDRPRRNASAPCEARPRCRPPERLTTTSKPLSLRTAGVTKATTAALTACRCSRPLEWTSARQPGVRVSFGIRRRQRMLHGPCQSLVGCGLPPASSHAGSSQQRAARHHSVADGARQSLVRRELASEVALRAL